MKNKALLAIKQEIEYLRALQIYYEIIFDLFPLENRYNHNHGSDGKFTSGSGTANAVTSDAEVDKMKESDIIKSGAQNGAYNNKNDPDFKKRNESAKNYYEEVRNRNRDIEIKAISKNSGLTIEDSDAVFSHVFETEHLFEDGSIRRFDPDYYMQQSFMRIREGKNIQPHDKTLLMHELTESKIMKANPNMCYEEAHAIAQKKYNYHTELKEYLKKKGK